VGDAVVGLRVGITVGRWVGLVGRWVGLTLGLRVGTLLGITVGVWVVGALDGFEGNAVGLAGGPVSVGHIVDGLAVTGILDGEKVGVDVGVLEGVTLGAYEGDLWLGE